MRFLISFLFVFTLFPLAVAQADWEAVDREVVCRLLFDGKDREEWLAELQAKAEKTSEDDQRIFMLAARSDDEAAALDALERFGTTESLFDALEWTIHTLENPELARHLVERFPQAMVSGPSVPSFFNEDFFPDLEETDPETVRLWVEARYQAYPIPADSDLTNPWEPANPWTDLRFQAFLYSEKIDELLDELERKTRTAENEPARTAALMEFLWTLNLANHSAEERPKRDLKWIRTCVPAHALKLFDAAEFLGNPDFHEFQTAYDFLVLAQEKPPMKADEIEKLRARFIFAPEISNEVMLAVFQTVVTQNLADVCEKLNRPEEAKKWRLESEKWAEKTKGFDFDRVMLGRSRTRVPIMESGEVREREKLSEDSPEYWRDRVEYYSRPERRKESGKDLEKALLRLYSFPCDDYHAWALVELAELWYAQGHKAEVKKLLSDEIRTAPKDSRSWQIAISCFVREDFQDILEPDLPELWDVLQETEDWGPIGMRILSRIFETVRETEPEKLDEYYARAEKLVDGPQRAVWLGWVFNQMKEPERSLPFLRRGAQLQDELLKNFANFWLLKSLMDLRRWDEALAQFPAASKSDKLETSEIPEWLAQIEEGAREDGNGKVAAECERRRKNLRKY